jgi:hypothetical protein
VVRDWWLARDSKSQPGKEFDIIGIRSSLINAEKQRTCRLEIHCERLPATWTSTTNQEFGQRCDFWRKVEPNKLMRKVVAIAAVPGLIAGIYIFIASFFGLSMDKLGTKVFLLHLGIFALFIPLVGVERWSKGVDPFRGRPRWVIRSMQIPLSPVCCGLLHVPRFESRCIPGNHQWRAGDQILVGPGSFSKRERSRPHFSRKR